MMKSFLAFGLAMLLSVATVGRAEASQIVGNIAFGGIINIATDLATTDSLDFENPVNINYTDGDFLAEGVVPAIGAATFNDFTFDPLPVGGVIPLWTVPEGFSFDLLTVVIDEQDSDSLVLQGTGVMNGPAGYDPTPYSWSFSADRTGIIAFSATNAPLVPEPASLALLGLGLAGVAAARRRRAKA